MERRVACSGNARRAAWSGLGGPVSLEPSTEPATAAAAGSTPRAGRPILGPPAVTRPCRPRCLVTKP